MRLAAIVLAAAAVAAAGCSDAPAPAPSAPAGPANAPSAASGDLSYPLTTCVVSGEALGGMGDPVVYMHEGKEVRFCCGKCVAEFQKDPAKYLAILEAARKK